MVCLFREVDADRVADLHPHGRARRRAPRTSTPGRRSPPRPPSSFSITVGRCRARCRQGAPAPLPHHRAMYGAALGSAAALRPQPEAVPGGRPTAAAAPATMIMPCMPAVGMAGDRTREEQTVRGDVDHDARRLARARRRRPSPSAKVMLCSIAPVLVRSTRHRPAASTVTCDGSKREVGGGDLDGPDHVSGRDLAARCGGGTGGAGGRGGIGRRIRPGRGLRRPARSPRRAARRRPRGAGTWSGSWSATSATKSIHGRCEFRARTRSPEMGHGPSFRDQRTVDQVAAVNRLATWASVVARRLARVASLAATKASCTAQRPSWAHGPPRSTQTAWPGRVSAASTMLSRSIASAGRASR